MKATICTQNFLAKEYVKPRCY